MVTHSSPFRWNGPSGAGVPSANRHGVSHSLTGIHSPSSFLTYPLLHTQSSTSVMFNGQSPFGSGEMWRQSYSHSGVPPQCWLVMSYRRWLLLLRRRGCCRVRSQSPLVQMILHILVVGYRIHEYGFCIRRHIHENMGSI